MSCIRTAWDKAGSGCPSGTPRATNGPFHGVCHLRGRDVRGLLAATGGGVGEVRGHTSERLQPVHMACVRTVGASCQKMPVRRIEDEETSGQAEGWIRRTAGVPDRTCRPRACCRANDPKPENQRATSLKRSHGALRCKSVLWPSTVPVHVCDVTMRWVGQLVTILPFSRGVFAGGRARAGELCDAIDTYHCDNRLGERWEGRPPRRTSLDHGPRVPCRRAMKASRLQDNMMEDCG